MDAKNANIKKAKDGALKALKQRDANPLYEILITGRKDISKEEHEQLRDEMFFNLDFSLSDSIKKVAA